MGSKSKLLIIHEDDMDWVYSPEERVHWKMLGPGNEKRGPCMQLIKVPAGYRKPRHYHASAHMIYVREGDYSMAGKRYRPGTFIFVPTKERAGPIESKNGCVLIQYYEGAIGTVIVGK